MHRHFLGATAAFVVLVVVSAPARAQASLNELLTPFLAKYDLPAVAAAVVKDGKIVAAGAVGTRRAGQDIPVTIEDRFHIGSDTKAMGDPRRADVRRDRGRRTRGHGPHVGP